jgi:hypothetical protein
MAVLWSFDRVRWIFLVDRPLPTVQEFFLGSEMGSTGGPGDKEIHVILLMLMKGSMGREISNDGGN